VIVETSADNLLAIIRSVAAETKTKAKTFLILIYISSGSRVIKRSLTRLVYGQSSFLEYVWLKFASLRFAER
jgi:hypothetical protein